MRLRLWNKRFDDDLFIGITTWNSEMLLPVCLESLKETTNRIKTKFVVLDNQSIDRTREIARGHGAEVISKACTQGDALNHLVRISRAKYTLLIHADVVFLNPIWFERVTQTFRERTALVAPNDIGCGPLTRPFGLGKPESSFLFFKTDALHDLREFSVSRKRFSLVLERRVNFYGKHVTHDLPDALSAKGYEWEMMQVHVSEYVDTPIYQPAFKPAVWSDELACLRYGLGNFYSIGGQITHYHNWFDRVPKAVNSGSREGTSKSGGFPLEYISVYTQAFLRDYRAHKLRIPPATPDSKQPQAL